MFGGGKFGESSVIRQTKTIQTFPLKYIQSSCVTHLVFYTPIHCCSGSAIYSELLLLLLLLSNLSRLGKGDTKGTKPVQGTSLIS